MIIKNKNPDYCSPMQRFGWLVRGATYSRTPTTRKTVSSRATECYSRICTFYEELDFNKTGLELDLPRLSCQLIAGY